MSGVKLAALFLLSYVASIGIALGGESAVLFGAGAGAIYAACAAALRRLRRRARPCPIHGGHAAELCPACTRRRQ